MARMKSSVPMTMVIFRHVDQEGFKTVSIKEITFFVDITILPSGEELSNHGYVTLLTDGVGEEREKKIWNSLKKAIEHYDSL